MHGSAFFFDRNEDLASPSPVQTPGTRVQEIRNNQFGFATGGPIIKNKTFFFFNYEGLRLLQGQIQTATVPSVAQRTGNFGTNGTVTNIDPTAGTGRLGTCSRKLIPRRGKRSFISTNRTCWNKA